MLDRRLLLLPWAPGPESVRGPVIVSVTEFIRKRHLDIPSMSLVALRLRMGWYAMPGAIGMWLWAAPLSRRSGSISVWSSEQALQRFVRLPYHAEIMRRYRPRATVRATSWRADSFDRPEIITSATKWLAS